jgi:hypothetical protein
MTSDRQHVANRRNAQRSTGPRSAAGKSASRRNALRHGLSARLGQDPALDRRVEALAKIIAKPNATESELHYARIAADATLQITRIRALRTTMMDPASRTREVFSWSFPQRVTWQRSYRANPATFNAIADRAEQDPRDGSTFGERFIGLAAPLKRSPPRPRGPEANVVIFSRFIDQVAKLDRYEARELSRRKASIRALEALRASKPGKSLELA